MVARAGGAGSLNFIPASCVSLQIEPVREAAIHVFEVGIGGIPDGRADVGWRCSLPGRVLIYESNRVVVAAVLMATAEFYALLPARKCEAIVHGWLLQLLWEQRILDAYVGLIEDVPSANVPTAGRAKRQIQLELANPHAQGIRGQLQETANVDKLQVTVTQSASGIRSADVEVGVHPERDSVTEIPRHEHAEESWFKVGARNHR